jgi:hypothetical protein
MTGRGLSSATRYEGLNLRIPHWGKVVELVAVVVVVAPKAVVLVVLVELVVDDVLVVVVKQGTVVGGDVVLDVDVDVEVDVDVVGNARSVVFGMVWIGFAVVVVPFGCARLVAELIGLVGKVAVVVGGVVVVSGANVISAGTSGAPGASLVVSAGDANTCHDWPAPDEPAHRVMARMQTPTTKPARTNAGFRRICWTSGRTGMSFSGRCLAREPGARHL